MRILHTVESYPPSIGGMQEVVRQLSERLAARGHEVTVATSRVEGGRGADRNGVRIREFDVRGNLVAGMRGDVAGYRKFLREGGFDVMANFAAQQWATDAAITMLDAIPGRKVFVPTGFSRLFSREYRDYFRSMAGWMRRYDVNVFLSETYRDAAFAREHGVLNRVMIPNGAGEDEFSEGDGSDLRRRLDIPADAFLVLHVGSHTGEKGHREAMEIFRDARMRNAVFLLVGNDAGGCGDACRGRAEAMNGSREFRSSGKRVLVRVLPRRDTVSAYLAADLFLFPSNIECSPLVLFESAASGTPFLSTDVGNAAEIAEWTSGGAILPTDKGGEGGMGEIHPRLRRLAEKLLPFLPLPIPPDHSRARIAESAALLERMHDAPEERRRMGEAGRKAWRERFTWERIVVRYESMYASLAGGGPWSS